MRKKPTVLAVILLSGALLLAGCGGGDDSMSGMDGMNGMSSSSPADAGDASQGNFNDADVTFATDMIPHHRQAVEMADLASTRASSPEVTALAAQIKDAQDPEIETMSGWLASWGQPVPEDMSGMDMSSSMPGMMSMDDMSALEDASGAEFDRMFLTMMIEHHEGAIEMAQTEQADGLNPEAISLAKDIEAAQTVEIANMKDLLADM